MTSRQKAPDNINCPAHYRVGNGSIGNIGRDSLAHLVINPKMTTNADAIALVRNPLAAAGGVDAITTERRVDAVSGSGFTWADRITRGLDLAQTACNRPREQHAEFLPWQWQARALSSQYGP